MHVGYMSDSIHVGWGKESPVYFTCSVHKSKQCGPIEADLLSEIASAEDSMYTFEEFQGILFLTSSILFQWS